MQFPGTYPDFYRHLEYFATQRAAGRASMRAYMIIYGSFRPLAVRCIVLLGAGRPPTAIADHHQNTGPDAFFERLTLLPYM